MTATYDLQSNSITELPQMEKPEMPRECDYSPHGYSAVLRFYNIELAEYKNHVDQLRKIRCARICKRFFTDKVLLEEGKDYKVCDSTDGGIMAFPLNPAKQEPVLRWVKASERNPKEEWFGPIRYRHDEKNNIWEYDADASRSIQCNFENYPDVEWLEETTAPIKSDEEDWREVIAMVARDNVVSRIIAVLKSKYIITKR